MRNSSNCLSLCNFGESDICRVLTVTGKLVNVGIMWVALAVNVTILKILLIQLCHRKLICGLMVMRTSVSGAGVSGSVHGFNCQCLLWVESDGVCFGLM